MMPWNMEEGFQLEAPDPLAMLVKGSCPMDGIIGICVMRLPLPDSALFRLLLLLSSVDRLEMPDEDKDDGRVLPVRLLS